MSLSEKRQEWLVKDDFTKFKKFFMDLYKMPYLFVYMKSTELTYIADMFKINGDENTSLYKGESPVELRTSISREFKTRTEDGHTYTYIMQCNLNSFINLMFGDNYLQWHYWIDVERKDKMIIGLSGLLDNETNELCKVGFSKSVCYTSNTNEKPLDSVEISVADLYNNINEIYELFYGE